ncbi:hypothetical protein XENOCAPTIV_008409 [Xenoophorus captivus]|uniref:Secreted protein n=1 Tax=Xenoophorus captivus TaxID=1517983 RepID=A0ABV0SEE2_9TELE
MMEGFLEGPFTELLVLLLSSSWTSTCSCSKEGGREGADIVSGSQILDEGNTARIWVVALVVVQGERGTMWAGTVAVVPGGWPDDDVSAVVRARASILAEVELGRLNLQHRG